MEWMTLPLKRYAVFSGRSRRKEFWMFFLFCVIVGVLTAMLDAILGFGWDGYGPINLLASIALLIPSIAVAVRRLHDTDRSGWWVLLSLIPILGGLALLALCCLDGTLGPNRFGDDPKSRGGGAAETFA